MGRPTISVPPFWVGQWVVAVENHPQGLFKKGDEFQVEDVKMQSCCRQWTVKLFGVRLESPFMYCSCRTETSYVTDHFILAKRFAPKQQKKFPLMTFKEIFESVPMDELIFEN